MAKLSLIKRLSTSNSQKGQAKSLLHKHNGPISDSLRNNDDDDDDDSHEETDEFGGDIHVNGVLGDNDDDSLVSCETNDSKKHKRFNNKHSSRDHHKDGKSKHNRNHDDISNHKSKSKNKNKNNNNKRDKKKSNFILRKLNSASSHLPSSHFSTSEHDDGYESDNSAGSTRSTSSSFLRYQNRSKWKAKLTSGKKSKVVLEKKGDGSEVPVGTSPTSANAGATTATKGSENGNELYGNGGWPLFEKIYKRQNNLLKKGEVGEDGKGGSSDEEEEDDVNDDNVEGVVAMPTQMVVVDPSSKNGEDEECDDDDDSEAFVDGVEKQHQLELVTPRNDTSIVTEPTTISSPETTQESGIPTCEMPPPEKSIQYSVPAPPHLQTWSTDSASTPTFKSASAPSPTSEQALSPSTDKTTNDDNITNMITEETSSNLANGHKISKQKSKSKKKSSKSKSHHHHLSSSSKPSIESPSSTTLTHTPNTNRTTIGARKEDGDILTPLSIPRTICYSLRSAIGDGSARQRNSKSLMELRILRPNGCHLDCGYWSHRGKRSYMEDRFVIEHIGSTDKKNKANSKPIAWLGVFDGHGGAAASQFCSDWLSSYVRKNPYYPQNLPMAMKDGFMNLDKDFVSAGYLDGSTACTCAVIGKEKVICCNAGDSRAIIVKRDGSFVALSEDHKPGRLDETKRINELGGRVIYWGRWRVEGVLAVSRSIGDARLKPYVTAEPEMSEHYIGEDDMFLVIASDGVWDTMTSDLVAKFVLVNTCHIVDKSLKVDDRLLRWIARKVSKRARENGSSDNVSCIVANLKSK